MGNIVLLLQIQHINTVAYQAHFFFSKRTVFEFVDKFLMEMFVYLCGSIKEDNSLNYYLSFTKFVLSENSLAAVADPVS